MANNSGEFKKWFKGGGVWLLAGALVCIVFWCGLLAFVGWKPVVVTVAGGLGVALVVGAVQEVRARVKRKDDAWRSRWR